LPSGSFNIGLIADPGVAIFGKATLALAWIARSR
jgi:hypothetical protein